MSAEEVLAHAVQRLDEQGTQANSRLRSAQKRQVRAAEKKLHYARRASKTGFVGHMVRTGIQMVGAVLSAVVGPAVQAVSQTLSGVSDMIFQRAQDQAKLGSQREDLKGMRNQVSANEAQQHLAEARTHADRALAQLTSVMEAKGRSEERSIT